MKRYLLATSLLATTLMGNARADVTINVTGATAFRAAALNAIRASYTSVNYAYNGTDFAGSTYALFVGSFPGISGTTTIRTSFTGSVEGIRDLALNRDVPFLPTTGDANPQPVSSGGTQNAVVANLVPAKAKFAFSDVYQNATPYRTPALGGANAGVITFVFVANQGSTISNVTSQQFRAIAGNGLQPLSLFTGNAADTKLVYLTGRNDGSGTRVTTLAETAYGYSNPVNQWKPVTTGAEPNTAVTTLQYWPVNDGANASVIYNSDLAGNGGFNSGSTLRTVLGGTSTAVKTLDETGATINESEDLLILGYAGTSDAYTASTNGAVVAGYNGVTITPISSGLSATDAAKVYNGQYTFWGYEHFFFSGSLTADQSTFNTKVLSTIPANLGNAGLAIANMNVARGSDGGLVGP